MKKIFKNETRRLNILFAILIIIAIAIVFLVNALSHTLSTRYPLSADLTANASYDIGDDTKEVLNSLNQDVDIYVLATKASFGGDSYLVQAEKILEQYPKYSSYINLEFIDYTSNPTFAASYADLDLNSGDILVVGPEQIKQIPLQNLFNYTYDEDENLQIVSSRTEEAVTSAIVSSVTADPVNVGILTGNSVLEDRSTLESILNDNNFVVEEVDMTTGDFSGYEILILLAPQTDLSEDVLSKFDSFLYNNGEYGRILLYAADVDQPELTNIDAFLREWGIQVDDGAVFETDEAYAYGYQPYYPFTDYTDETFMKLLKDSSNKVLMPLSRPLTLVYEYKDNVTVTTLLSFSESSGVRPSDADDSFVAEEAVRFGPMPAMTMSTLSVSGAPDTSCVIVSASANAFASTAISNTSVANASYLTSMLNYLTEREESVSIEPKSLSGNILSITTAQSSVWSIILCVAVPLLILFAGIFIFLKRRYR